MKDNSLFFLILSLTSIWLILDEFYGHNYISKFIIKMIPKAEDESIFTGQDGNKLLNDNNNKVLNSIINVGNRFNDGLLDNGESNSITAIDKNGNKYETSIQWDGKNWVDANGAIYN